MFFDVINMLITSFDFKTANPQNIEMPFPGIYQKQHIFEPVVEGFYTKC